MRSVEVMVMMARGDVQRPQSHADPTYPPPPQHHDLGLVSFYQSAREV